MPADNPLSPRAIATGALKLALRLIEKPKTVSIPTIKATANAAEDSGITISSLQRSLTDIADARKEMRTTFGSSLTMEAISLAIREAGRGSMQALTDLSRETISYDPHLGSVLQKRFGALSSLPWEVQVAEGPGVDKEKALFYAIVVRDQLRKLPGFRKNLKQLSWGIFDGRAALENHWKTATEPLIDQRFGRVSMVLNSIAWIHPRLLSFGYNRQLIITSEKSRSSGNYGATGIDISDEALKKAGLWRKFVSWTPQLFGEYPEKEGLAPRCLNWSFFKRFTVRDMMTLIELFGKPWRVIEVPEESNASSEDLAASLEAVDALGGAYTALLAKGTKLEVHQPGRTAGQIHNEIIKEVDQQISKLVLGQTGTTDGVPAGLNSDQANVMQEEQLLILKNDADAIGEVVEQQITDAIIEANFGAAELIHAPRFVLRSDRPADRNTEIGRLKSALDAGIEVKVTEAYEVAGFQIPDEEDPVIRIDQPKMESGATQTPVPRAMIIYPDEENDIVDELLEDEDGEEEIPEGMSAVWDKLITNLSKVDAKLLCNALANDQIGHHSSNCGCIVHCASDKDGDDAQEFEYPSSDFGNPDDFVTKNRKSILAETDKWANQISSAIGDASNSKQIVARIKKAIKKLDTSGYAKVLGERTIQSAALGMLDNALEIGDISARKAKASNTQQVVSLSFSTTPFKSAIKSFLARDIISKEEWKRIEDELKRKSFTIAGVETHVMRDKIFALLANEISEGADIRGFRKRMISGLQAAGMITTVKKSGLLSASHVDNVFRTNVLNAYNHGRHEHATQPSVMERFPVWEIRAVIDNRTRDFHRSANGIMLRANDPFFKKAYPPFGFQCRCRVISRSTKYLPQVVDGSTIIGLPDDGFVSGI